MSSQGAGELDRLEARADDLTRQLQEILDEIDRRKKRQQRAPTPEERRRQFRLIQGGAAVLGAVVTVGAALKRPVVAAASGTTAAGVGLAMLYGTMPAPEPPPNDRARAPYLMEEPAEAMPREDARVVAEIIDEPAPTSKPSATPTAKPSATAAPQPVSTPKPTQTASQPSSTPVPKPTATASASATIRPSTEPLVEIEVNAEDKKACVDSNLVGLELAVCLNR